MEKNNHSDHDHEKCKALFASLSEYIDNELNDEQYNRIKNHLEGCQCCSTCLLTLEKTIGLCKKIGDEPVPQDLSERLRDLLRNFS